MPDALQDDEGMEAAKLEGVHSGLSRSDCGLRPLYLNPDVRHFFQTTSSCITCHALASINGAGERLDFFSPMGAGPLGLPIGWVDEVPTGFHDENGEVLFTQLDFVWLLFRARSKQ